MQAITSHPVLPIQKDNYTFFTFEGKQIKAQKELSIATALHRAGFNVHSHSLTGRNRSLSCGIGKCGACEMLVDGVVKRICITPAAEVKEVKIIENLSKPAIPKSTKDVENLSLKKDIKTLYTRVCITGAGPAGLAAREELNSHKIENIVIDANEKTGGQFLMQTHAFFFFEQKKRFGGMRGFDIADSLVGDNKDGILLNCTVWDILSDKKVAVKNLLTNEIFYVSCEYLIVATGAIPFMPAFKNDDLPGVYTAAVFQKMMNSEYTLIGKNILTVGAGNIGYLTSYQAIQAGAEIKAIIEAMPHSGGFPVQENRIKRLGVPIITSTILLEAIPNNDNTGITGAVVARAENFMPVKNTEKIIDGIDMINICTGLLPDNSLLSKGKIVFGQHCFGAGDAVRIGEGTSAVLRGKQCAMEIIQALGIGSANSAEYRDYLEVSKKYIESQQHPVRIKDAATLPDSERQYLKPFVVADCLYGFACNPCTFVCPNGAISKVSTSSVPEINYEKCTGCMACVTKCPGLAIFGYDINRKKIYFPAEYFLEAKTEIALLDSSGNKVGKGIINKIITNKNKTNLVIVDVEKTDTELTLIRGFLKKDIAIDNPPQLWHSEIDYHDEPRDFFLCHCDDVKLSEILEQIGGRTVISIEEIKHLTHLGMGVCRGKRCIPRLRTVLRSKGITLTGDPLPRAPMANSILLKELANTDMATLHYIFPKISKTYSSPVFIAGGGMGGTSLFRYMAEKGFNPIMANHGRGSSWRNISGGRTAFSVPELAEIASKNHEIFRELEKEHSIDYHPIRYITFAHNGEMLNNLEKATLWSKARIIDKTGFVSNISPYINRNNPNYIAAQITDDCWQASPGKTVDLLRYKGLKYGGTIFENTEVIAVEKSDSNINVFLKNANGEFIKVVCSHFVNSLGSEAEKFARMFGLETGLYPVKHQAFITRRLPFLGINGHSLDMLIDRREKDGFSAFYGQQLQTTGQLILCASPAVDTLETGQPLSTNSQDFLRYVATSLLEWFPHLSSESFQATWAGYYVEPRYIIDPVSGIFAGLRGHGFMLSMYLAKLYTEALAGGQVPSYFARLSLNGDALEEKSFR
ncbi:MAG: FAD-dependent oxidoreductase [Bacteroidales bacterium]|jgi:glycine/D-amino acid oxidase-like deaminating enzyme/Fe-S-cluster-containing hydrogenase component 2|nr:FAD-dependent oxidoreductase [Bacteroidales bacterium]